MKCLGYIPNCMEVLWDPLPPMSPLSSAPPPPPPCFHLFFQFPCSTSFSLREQLWVHGLLRSRVHLSTDLVMATAVMLGYLLLLPLASVPPGCRCAVWLHSQAFRDGTQLCHLHAILF